MGEAIAPGLIHLPLASFEAKSSAWQIPVSVTLASTWKTEQSRKMGIQHYEQPGLVVALSGPPQWCADRSAFDPKSTFLTREAARRPKA